LHGHILPSRLHRPEAIVDLAVAFCCLIVENKVGHVRRSGDVQVASNCQIARDHDVAVEVAGAPAGIVSVYSNAARAAGVAIYAVPMRRVVKAGDADAAIVDMAID